MRLVPRRARCLRLALLAASPVALGAQEARLTISPAPVVRIGGDADTASEFTHITGAAQLRSGELLVSDARTPAVRVFGADGRYVRALGRAGAGPGEFRSVTLLSPAADTVLVWDGSLRRLTRYLVGGQLVGTIRVTASGGDRPIGLVSRLPNGRWLVSTSYVPSLMRAGGTYEDSVHVGTIDPPGAGAVRWIGWYPGATFWVWKPNASADHGESVGFSRFSAITRVLVVDGHIVIASGGTNDVRVLDATGRLVGRFGTPVRPQSVTETQRVRARDEAVANAQNELSRARLTASYDRSAIPKIAPAFDNVLATTDELWLQAPQVDPLAPSQCTVMRLDGTTLGQVMLPPRARVLDIGRDFVWMAVTDDDGVERLEKHALRRR